MRLLQTMLVVCLLLAFGSAAPGIPAKPRYDPQYFNPVQLQGIWRQAASEYEGSPNSSRNYWLITSDKITILSNPDRLDQNNGSWMYRIDFSKSPAELDLTPTSNNPGGKITYPCLLQLEGDRITVCLQNIPARGRPVDLQSRPNSAIGKFVYERIK